METDTVEEGYWKLMGDVIGMSEWNWTSDPFVVTRL